MPRGASPQRCDETCPGALTKTTSDSSKNELSRNTSNCTICDSVCQSKSHVSTISNSSLSKADEGKKKWIICFRGIFAKNKFNESPSEPTSQLKDSATDLKSIKTEGSGSECSCCDCKKKNDVQGEKELCDCPDKSQCSVECQQSNNPEAEKDKKELCDCIDKTQCSEECQRLNNVDKRICSFEDTLPEPLQLTPQCVDFNDTLSTDTSTPQPCENDCSPNNLDNSRKFSCPDTCPLTTNNFPAPSACPALSSKVSTGSEVSSKRHAQNETSVPFKASIFSIRPTECPNLIIPPVCLHICSEITPVLPIISEGCFEDLNDPESTPNTSCPIPIKKCTDPPDSTVPDSGNSLSCNSSCSGSCHSTEMDIKSNPTVVPKECTKSSSNESNCSCCVCIKDSPKQVYGTICPSESPKFPIFTSEGSKTKPTSSTQTACKCPSTSSDVSALDVSDIPLFVCPAQKYTTDSPTVCPKQKSRSVEVNPPICKYAKRICQKGSIQSASSCRCLGDEKDDKVSATVVKSEQAASKCPSPNCPAGDTNTTEGGTDLVKKTDKPRCQASHHVSMFKPKCSLVCRNKNVSPVCSLESEMICFKMSESIEVLQSTEFPSQASFPKKTPNFQKDCLKPKICRRMQNNHAKSISRKISTVTICLVDCSTLTNSKCANIIPTNSTRSSKKFPASAASVNTTDTTDSKHVWKTEARPSSASESRLDEFSEEECSCNNDSMNQSQKSSSWSHKYNQKPPCSFCRQPVQDCVCSSKKPTSDWTQPKSNTLFRKYKCTICKKPILECKCKPSIFEDDDSSGSSEPKEMSPKCSTCNKPIQNCKCNEDSAFSGRKNKSNPKPKYYCSNCNKQIQECICKQTVCESDDDSGEDLDSICESSQTNLNECKCLACARESARKNDGCPLRTFPKRSQAKCIGCYKLLQDCTCKPSENIMKIDELDYNNPQKCSRCNKKNQECTCRSKQSQPKCPGCNRPLKACICKSQMYQKNIMNKTSSSVPAYTKYKCKTCNQQVQDCTCNINISKEDCTYRNTPNLPKPNVAKCIGCKKPLQDCICKPSVPKAASYGKYKCTSCSLPIPVCTCDTDFSRNNNIYQKSSVSTRPSLAKCLGCNKPLQDCTCKPNICEDNSWERSYNNKASAKYNCTNCYQPVEDCTCDSNNPSQDFTNKKSQLSSVKCVRSFSRNNPSRTKPKQKCLCCKKPIQDCKCTSIAVESSSSNETVDCSCKSNTREQRLDDPSSENEVGPKCLGCNRPLKDCTCRDSRIEASNYSFSKTKSFSKPAFTKYKCSSCSMPLLECKCSPSNTASVVIDRDDKKTPSCSKQSSSRYKPSISKDEEREIDDFSFQNTYVCVDCNKPIQECKCRIDKTPNKYSNKGFSRSAKSQPKYKCSECYKPLQQCTCKSEISESVSDLECFDCNEPINQCECKPNKYETSNRSSVNSRPKYVCCSCKKPIEDCTCQSNQKDISSWDQKYTCSECRQPIQKCKCKQDVEDDSIPIPALPKLKYLSCDNSAGKGERSKVRSCMEQDNYSSNYSKSRSRTKYICCKCNKPIEECTCKTNDDLMDQINGSRSGKCFSSSEQKNICSNCSNYAQPEPSCELLEDYPCKITSVGKNTSNRRYNISSEGRPKTCNQDNIEDNRKQDERSVVCKSSDDASHQLNRKCNDLCPKQSMKRSSNKSFCQSPKKKSIKICRPKDFPQFPHPSLLSEPCPDTCETKSHLDCPLKKECSSMNLKSSKYRSTAPARKQFDMYCTLDKPLSSRIQPSLSFKDEFTDCPPLFLKVCPVPKVGSRCSASRIKKFPSKIRNCVVSKVASRKSFKERRRSPQNCSSGMRDNKCPFRERDSNRRLYQKKSCKRCNQPIPEYQSVEDNVGYSSITNDMKNYSSHYQNNKNCKFN